MMSSKNHLLDMVSFLDVPQVGVALYEITQGQEYYSPKLELNLNQEQPILHGFSRFGVQNKLRDCNEHFASLSGYSKEELLNHPNFFNLVSTCMSKEDVLQYQEDIKNDRPWHGFGSWKRKDKRPNGYKFINKAIHLNGSCIFWPFFKTLPQFLLKINPRR